MAARTLVVGADFSETSARALEWAAEIAAACDARILLVHALQTVTLGPDYEVAAARLDATTQDVLRGDLERAAEPARRRGVEVVASLPAGGAADALLEVADEADACLVVVGTAGRSGLARLVVGSVATSVVQRSPRPVLAVRHDHADPDRSGPLVVATAFEGEPERAASTVRALFEGLLEGSQVVLVHAPAKRPAASVDPALDRVALQLREAGKAFEEAGASLDCVVRAGDAAHVVVEVARERGARLIALGARQRSRLAGGILGSTAKTLLPDAPCPVLTLPLGEVE